MYLVSHLCQNSWILYDNYDYNLGDRYAGSTWLWGEDYCT